MSDRKELERRLIVARVEYKMVKRDLAVCELILELDKLTDDEAAK